MRKKILNFCNKCVDKRMTKLYEKAKITPIKMTMEKNMYYDKLLMFIIQ